MARGLRVQAVVVVREKVWWQEWEVAGHVTPAVKKENLSLRPCPWDGAITLGANLPPSDKPL